MNFKKSFSIYLFILILFNVGCKQESLSIADETKKNLLKDQDFITYSNVSKDFREKTSYDYYNYRTINRVIFEKELKAVHSDTELIKLYAKVGVKNADEFVENQNILHLMENKLLDKYPYLKSINRREALQYIISITEKPNFDINKIKASASQSNS